MEKKIRTLIKEAMIEKNKNKQITYKNILETAQKTAKKTNAEVTDEMIISAIKTEIKQLKDVLAFCKEGDAKYVEISEKLAFCEMVLPSCVSNEEVKAFLKDNSIEKNIGICMKKLKEHFGTSLDGKSASGIAKEYCNS